MSYQLSPDRQYYWDGTRWVSVVSPDGAWRWDGTAWRPAQARGPRVNGAVVAVIAIAVIAALGLGALGVFALTRLVGGAQQSLQSHLGPACTQTGGVGHDLAEGDSLCGRTLGASVVSVDCTTESSLPSTLTAEMATSGASTWKPADIGMDSRGCSMLAQPDQDVAVDSTDVAAANVVVVADFVPQDSTGSVGLRIACTADGSCLDVMVNSDETYSLAEGVPNGDWKDLSDGSLILGYMRYGQANRLILRFAGGVASVYLNGYELTHTKPDLAQVSGYFGFYVEDGGSSKAEQVLLQRMYVFQAL